MARVIRFPLQMKDGAAVRTLEELRDHFDPESVLGYFADGKLKTWLANRYYDELAQKVGELTVDSPDLHQKLCEIIGVEFSEENADVPDIEQVQRRQEKLRILSQITDDKAILDNVDAVAFDQDELYDILDEAPTVVYMYGDKFSIPYAKGGITYIGVNRPEVSLEKNEFDYNNHGILLKNVAVPKDQSIITIQFAEHLILKGKYQEAFPIVQMLAENGNARAMYHMAQYYAEGFNTVRIDYNLRNEWCTNAFSYHEPLSSYAYATWCLDEENREKQYKNLFFTIKELAEENDPFAQDILGIMYGRGREIENNLSQSKNWLEKAARSNLAQALFEYGEILISQIWEEKFILLHSMNSLDGTFQAVNSLIVSGSLIVGSNQNTIQKTSKKDSTDDRSETLLKCYLTAAKQGHIDAQRKLGLLYEGKTQEHEKNTYISPEECISIVPMDMKMSLEWYQKAADQGVESDKSEIEKAEMRMNDTKMRMSGKKRCGLCNTYVNKDCFVCPNCGANLRYLNVSNEGGKMDKFFNGIKGLFG